MQISNEVQLGSAQIMGPCLRICKGRKVFSSIACIKLQCNRFCSSGREQCSLKVLNIQITWECYFTLFKNLSSALGNANYRHINNVFSFLMVNLSIVTLEVILKLFKSLWNTLLNPKNILYYVHTLVNLFDNDWAH